MITNSFETEIPEYEEISQLKDFEDAVKNSEKSILCGRVFLKQCHQARMFIFACDLCEKSFQDLEMFSSHLKECHIDIEDSNGSETQIEELEMEEKDVQQQDEGYLVRLEFELGHSDADENEANNSIISRHNAETVGKELTKFNCKYCSQHLNSVKQLRRHVCSTITTSVPFKSRLHQCSECSKTFQRKSNLLTHEYSHRSVKPFACNLCSASYANKQNLVVHQRRHKGEKPFVCDLCPNRFVSSTELHSHKRHIHMGDKPHICPECAKPHATASQLLEHRRRVHWDLREFKCNTCEKAFRSRAHLRSHHASLHEKLSRDKVCPVCQAAFKSVAALYAHSKIHTTKRYRCTLCEKAFAQHPGLYAHMKTHAKAENRTSHQPIRTEERTVR